MAQAEGHEMVVKVLQEARLKASAHEVEEQKAIFG
jgi:hypothetical protein